MSIYNLYLTIIITIICFNGLSCNYEPKVDQLIQEYHHGRNSNDGTKVNKALMQLDNHNDDIMPYLYKAYFTGSKDKRISILYLIPMYATNDRFAVIEITLDALKYERKTRDEALNLICEMQINNLYVFDEILSIMNRNYVDYDKCKEAINCLGIDGEGTIWQLYRCADEKEKNNYIRAFNEIKELSEKTIYNLMLLLNEEKYRNIAITPLIKQEGKAMKVILENKKMLNEKAIDYIIRRVTTFGEDIGKIILRYLIDKSNNVEKVDWDVYEMLLKIERKELRNIVPGLEEIMNNTKDEDIKFWIKELIWYSK